jgi:hypothetical protein
MNKERLEWVMSGLNRYVLKKTEDQFLRTVSEDFDKNHALTKSQEERLENLYKEKTKLIPNRTYFSPKASTISPGRKKLQKPRLRIMD